MGHLGLDRRQLAGFLRRVNERFPLEAAFAAGSRVRGTELETSDYDLVVVSRAFSAMPFFSRMVEVGRCWTADVPLEALCYTPEELERQRASVTTVAAMLADAVPLWPP